MALSLFVLMCR